MQKKILYIVPHRISRSPGQRFRCEQFIPYLQQQGFGISYSNLLTETEDRIFYSQGNYLLKFLIFLKSIAVRLFDVLRAPRYDVIFIYREAIMIGTTLFERLFCLTGAKVIYDFDDSIWLNDTSEGNKSLSWLKRPSKTADICKMVDLVIVGNYYLAQYAKNYSTQVVIIPTTIDTSYHHNAKGYCPKENVCIGWTGSSTTIKHFESILPVLYAIKAKYGEKVYFKHINNAFYENKELALVYTPWSLETEISALTEIDIGIMPLPDDEWSKGKCAFKGLQYMAMGIPAIMSPVGVNKEIIRDGENGFLAATTEEWIEKLSYLIENPQARIVMGEKGRMKVENEFSVNAIKNKYISLFDI